MKIRFDCSSLLHLQRENRRGRQREREEKERGKKEERERGEFSRDK